MSIRTIIILRGNQYSGKYYGNRSYKSYCTADDTVSFVLFCLFANHTHIFAALKAPRYLLGQTNFPIQIFLGKRWESLLNLTNLHFDLIQNCFFDRPFTYQDLVQGL